LNLQKTISIFLKHPLQGLTLLLAVMTIWQGCGRKGPPIPPRQFVPPAVADLTVSMDGDVLRLTWSVPRIDGKVITKIAGFIVYRSKTMLTDACQTCPLRFRQVADMRIESREYLKKPQAYTETLESGYAYRYKVTAYTRSRVMGKESNVVAIQR